MKLHELKARLFAPDTAHVSPVWGFVLGSGFGGWLNNLREARKVPFAQVESIRRPTVSGHMGYFVGGYIEDVPVAVCSGRLHLYEGLNARQVTAPVRALVEMGVSSVLLTAAVGVVSNAMEVGDLVVVTDQINLTGEDPHEGMGKFPDVSALYDLSYVDFLVENGFKKGTLAGVRGPSYETPAEVRALKILGADIVCMSTVLEVLALAGSGVRCVAATIAANRAGTPGTVHEDVVKTVESKTEEKWEIIRKLILFSSE